MCDGREEVRRSALGAAHLTPLSLKAPALQRGSLYYVKGESRWYCELHTMPCYVACDQQSCWAVRVHG